MDRCVVLVDAGYLLGAAATVLTSTALRSHLAVDHAALIARIRAQAETDTGRPLLRIYWFDGAPAASLGPNTAACVSCRASRCAWALPPAPLPKGWTPLSTPT